jgi:DegV family protein with EDD domain
VQQVGIVVDSSCCLPPVLASASGIQVVPFTIAFGDRVLEDGAGKADEFYDILRTSTALPKTAAPSPGAFLAAFRRAAEHAEGVLAITLPANLSSAHNSCVQAASLAERELPGVPVRCIQAGAVAAGFGLVALETARAAARGAGLEDAAALAGRLPTEVHFFAFLDSLEYLARGGHVPKAAAWLGDLVGLRPVLTAPHGDVRRITQARSRRGATERLLRLMLRHNPTRAPVQVLVMHAAAEPEAHNLRAEIEARFPCEEAHITQFTPVMGAHSGPGVLGVAFRVLTGEHSVLA